MQQEEYVKISLQRYEDLKSVRENTIAETERFKKDLLENNKEIMKLIGDFLKLPIRVELTPSSSIDPTYGIHFQKHLRDKGYAINPKGDSFTITKYQ